MWPRYHSNHYDGHYGPEARTYLRPGRPTRLAIGGEAIFAPLFLSVLLPDFSYIICKAAWQCLMPPGPAADRVLEFGRPVLLAGAAGVLVWVAQGGTVILHCHWLSSFRDLCSNLAIFASIFCHND